MKLALSLLTSITTVLLLLPAGAGAQTLSLVIMDGLVTLDARDVSVRQILQRWAEIGGVTLVNGDTVAATPVTLQLSSVPERAALDTLLRPVSGYILGRRPESGGIDRIVILAASTPASAFPRTAAPSVMPTPLPTVAAGDVNDSQPALADPDEIESAVQAGPNARQRPGVATGVPPAAFGVGGVSLTPEGQLQPGAVPPSMAIQYLDELDADGNRVQAPTVPLNDPPADGPPETAGQIAAPANPFGVRTATPSPGSGVPAPQPKP